MMVVGLYFFLSGFNQEPIHGRINCVICIMNYVGRLCGTFVRHNAKNNVRDPSYVQGYRNKKLDRVRGGGGGG